MPFWDDQPTQEQRELVADAIVALPSQARLLDQYQGVIDKARSLGVGLDEADSLQAKVNEALSAMRRLNQLAIGAARKWVEENPGTLGARELQDALANVPPLAGPYVAEFIAVGFIGAFAIIAGLILSGPLALIAIIGGALAIAAELVLALASALKESGTVVKVATSSGTNADGTVSPSLTSVANRGILVAGGIAALGAVSYLAWLFTKGGR